MYRLMLIIFIILGCCNIYANEFDLGAFPANQVQTHTFKITNSGTQTMILGKIRSSCTCDKNTLSTNKISPGGKATLTVELPAGSLAGQFSKTIYVETNLAKPRFLKFTLTGNAIELLKIQPISSIELNNLPTNQEISLQYEISATQSPVALQPDNPNPKIIKSLKIIGDEKNPAKSILNVVLFSVAEQSDFILNIPIKIITPANWPPQILQIKGIFKATKSIPPKK